MATAQGAPAASTGSGLWLSNCAQVTADTEASNQTAGERSLAVGAGGCAVDRGRFRSQHDAIRHQTRLVEIVQALRSAPTRPWPFFCKLCKHARVPKEAPN